MKAWKQRALLAHGTEEQRRPAEPAQDSRNSYTIDDVDDDVADDDDGWCYCGVRWPAIPAETTTTGTTTRQHWGARMVAAARAVEMESTRTGPPSSPAARFTPRHRCPTIKPRRRPQAAEKKKNQQRTNFPDRGKRLRVGRGEGAGRGSNAMTLAQSQRSTPATARKLCTLAGPATTTKKNL